MLRAELHRLGGLCVAREEETARAGLVADRGDLFFGIGDLLRAARRERLVAREQELDRVDARLRHLAHVGAHGRGAARMLRAFLGFQAERAVGQALERRGAQPRSGNPAAVDLLAQRDLETRPERAGRIGAGEPGVERDSGVPRRDQEVLLGRQDHGVDDAADRRGPREMRVRFDEAGHQCGAAAIDDFGALAIEAGARLAHGLDAVPPDEDLAGERWPAGAIEDLRVGEQQGCGHGSLRKSLRLIYSIQRRRDIMSFVNRLAVALTAVVAATTATSVGAQNVKIGVVTFLSGPAAAPFGVPAKNSAEFVVERAERRQGARRPTTRRASAAPTIEIVMHRRGGQHHDAGDGVPQPGAARRTSTSSSATSRAATASRSRRWPRS